MDRALLIEQARKAKLVVTAEDNALAGGFGEGVLGILADEGIETPTMTLAVPNRFISHATIAQQLAVCGLDSFGISRRIETRFRQITGAGR